jgi:hypothetical protein
MNRMLRTSQSATLLRAPRGRVDVDQPSRSRLTPRCLVDPFALDNPDRGGGSVRVTQTQHTKPALNAFAITLDGRIPAPRNHRADQIDLLPERLIAGHRANDCRQWHRRAALPVSQRQGRIARCSGERERRGSSGALVSPPRVSAALTITPAEEAVRPLIVRIRVRSLINAWSAVCLVLICQSKHGDHCGGCRLAR